RKARTGSRSPPPQVVWTRQRKDFFARHVRFSQPLAHESDEDQQCGLPQALGTSTCEIDAKVCRVRRPTNEKDHESNNISFIVAPMFSREHSTARSCSPQSSSCRRRPAGSTLCRQDLHP